MGIGEKLKTILGGTASEEDVKEVVVSMREKYNIKNLNPRKNPYSNRVKISDNKS